MLQNLHTHTILCDGKNTPEEMAERAFRLGFDSLGFSAHAVTVYKTDWELRDAYEYVNRIKKLKTAYGGKMEIFLGAELDYFSAGVMPTDELDYTIGSVHMAIKDGAVLSFDDSIEEARRNVFEHFGGDSVSYAKLYYSTLAEMPTKIRADIVGHFDLVAKFSELDPTLIDTASPTYRRAALEALSAVRERVEFFEVNTGAIGRGYKKTPYPADFILDEMRRLNAKLVLTSDCHDQDYLTCAFDEAKEYVKAHGFDTLYYLTGSGFVGEKV